MRAIYASGHRIEISSVGRFEGTPAVQLVVPEGTELTPDGARSVAVALIEHAAETERRINRQQARAGDER